MTIFDEYANILKGMYIIRFNGRYDLEGTSARPDTGRSDHGDTSARAAVLLYGSEERFTEGYH